MTMSTESRIFAAIVAFVQDTQRAADRALVDEDVSPAQFFILRRLAQERSATQVDLATALGVTAGNISQLVSKLERARLVERVGDGKAKLVSLTKQGEQLVARLAPMHRAFLRKRFAVLSEPERQLLLRLVERLGANDRA